MKYYMIVGNKITSEIVRSVGDVTALPLLDEEREVSLINEKHIIALMKKMNWDAAKAVDGLGLVDERAKAVSME